MYLTARSWGIQPGEFWGMTFSEYLLEAYSRMDETPEGRAQKRRNTWLAQFDMTDDEWWKAHGTSRS
jgi:hypothetical protein